MTFTGIMMTWIFYLRRSRGKAFLSLVVTLVDIVFLLSNTYKIPHGGYWSIILAAIPFSIILIYTFGQKKLYNSLKPMDIEEFLSLYNQTFRSMAKIKGTAIFLVRDMGNVPPYMVNIIFKNNIIYEDNIIVSIVSREEPFGVAGFFLFKEIAEGLRAFEIQLGYMEIIEVEGILRKAGIEEKVIFYGIEEIVTGHAVWKIFSFIKRLAPSFAQFHKLPSSKAHGVITRVEM